MMAMKNLKSKAVSTEVKCSACDGTGFPPVAQPPQAGRKIYPPPCKQCFGKGRINSA
jgi:DnaJ-class molecular chaperone